MIEVLKQALDALETEVSIDWTNNDEFNASAEKMHDAITSLQQAIAELESKEPVAWQERQAKRMKEGIVTEWSNWYSCDHRSINDARAEIYDHIPYEWRPLYTHPPQRTEQEPVACGTYQEVTDTMNALWAGTLEQVQIAEEMKNKKLYTAPPQRTWVGIEGEEIRNLWEEATKPDRSTMTMVTSFAKSIEAKLKEKNT